METVTIGVHAIEFKMGVMHAGGMAKFSRCCSCSSLRGVLIALIFATRGHDLPSLSHTLRERGLLQQGSGT
jgi:hypothetical protein